MSDRSSIEWTDATWNPVTGCTKVSPGCDNCYAETFAERWRGVPGHYFENGFDVQLRPDKLTQPMQWRKPRRVFVNSMSDLFHADVPDEYIARVFAVMALTPQHTYQILTKRHARMRSLITGRCTCGVGHPPAEHFRSEMAWAVSLANPNRIPGLPDDAEHRVYHEVPWPLPNVWLGVSVENQQWADIRVPALLHTPAAIRFLSCEPLLGPVDLKQAVRTMGSERGHGLTASFVHAGGCCRKFHGIDWVIAGGESGPKARPMHPDWARSLRDQCAAAGTAFFFKQWGEWAPSGWFVIGGPRERRRGEPLTCKVGDPVDDLGHRVEMARVGKGKAGRELDGRTWDEMPATVATTAA